jgi:hypothetical protein
MVKMGGKRRGRKAVTSFEAGNCGVGPFWLVVFYHYRLEGAASWGDFGHGYLFNEKLKCF